MNNSFGASSDCWGRKLLITASPSDWHHNPRQVQGQQTSLGFCWLWHMKMDEFLHPVLFRMSHQIIPTVPSGLPGLILCRCSWQASLSRGPWVGKRTWLARWALEETLSKDGAAPAPHQWEIWQGIPATSDKRSIWVNFLPSDGAHPFLDTAKSFLTGMTYPQGS